MIKKKEKDEISRLLSCLKDKKQELEFHKNHSSNNQLFVVLRKQITNIQKTDTKIQEMTSTSLVVLVFVVFSLICTE
jgi:hypothetical protein